MKGIFFLMIFCCFGLLLTVRAQKLIIVQNSKSTYNILLSKNATINEKLAASELQKYLLQISGAKLTITNESAVDRQIVIGNSDYIRKIDPGIDFKSLGNDGFVVKQKGNRLIFAGLDKGVLYGVYTFLERYLNCNMYAPDALVIPKRHSISLSNTYLRQIPKFKYREAFYWPSNDILYANWHKLDRSQGSGSNWGNWVHSVLELVPPAKYFKDHPEYYAERNGNRIPAQLCLSNPMVYKIVVEELKNKIVANRSAKYWSVSQADNGNYCQCDQCRAVDEREGSPSGSIINFVNKVAENFPEKTINTLAYSYSIVPPKSIRPVNNVLVTFCTTGNLDRGKPYHLGKVNMNYVKNISGWGNISKQLMIWDYVVDFKNYTMPFPNLSAISANIYYYSKNNASAAFMQGNYYGGGEFAELKCYLMSKLMWDPDSNSEQIIQDFLKGYYGGAAPYVSQYIQALFDAYSHSSAPLGIFDGPNDHLKDYLSIDNLNKYLLILNKAERIVEKDSVLYSRVKRITASINYAILNNNIYSAISDGKITRSTTGNLIYDTLDYKRLDQVYQALKSEKVVRISETSTTPEEYRAKILKIFNNAASMFAPDNLAIGKDIKLTYPPTAIHAKYAGNDALIDGIKGDLTSGLDTWQGFYGGKFEAIIDLQKVIKVKLITIDFLNTPAVNVVYPEKIAFYYSVDGSSYIQGEELKTDIVEKNEQSQIQTYSLKINSVDCRYIKISAFNTAKAPMITDEIVVK